METKPSSETEMTLIEEPSWMGVYRECCAIMKQVDLLRKNEIILESEISKEKMKKMSAVCEKKHDKVIQQFVQEATLVLFEAYRN